MTKVSHKLKTIISNESLDQESIEKLTDKVLGCLWDPKIDLNGIKFNFNHSKRRKGVKIKHNLTIQDLKKFEETCQTCRSLFSVCTRIF